MHVLIVGENIGADISDALVKQGIQITPFTTDTFFAVLNDVVTISHVVADAIIFVTIAGPESKVYPALLERRIRELPDRAAMIDGRKWGAVPTIHVNLFGDLPPEAWLGSKLILDRLGDTGLLATPYADADETDENVARDTATLIRSVVQDYRERVVNELDSLGLMVTYDRGRFRVCPAMKPRKTLSGYYYFGPADRREERFVTIDRDHFGVQLEMELFEVLINRQGVREFELQQFFEDHPHFLSRRAQPLPHVTLRATTGKVLIPDFILRPLAAVQRDSRWQVLELKRPQDVLLVGRNGRKRLSCTVDTAIRQLRSYGDYFADQRHAEYVCERLGYPLRRPKLGILIGRLDHCDIEALELEQSRIPDVTIVTYDEILEEQRALLS